MTKEELYQCLDAMDNEYSDYQASWKKRKQELLNKYVQEHARFQIGDIIRPNETTILVDEIYASGNRYAFGEVYAVYRGVILTKKLEPKKSGDLYTIHDDGREITKIEEKK